jgi:hypothetical protein
VNACAMRAPSQRHLFLLLRGTQGLAHGLRAGVIAGGPPVGWIGTAFSIPAGLLATAGYLLPSVPLVAWARALLRSEKLRASSNENSEQPE